MCRPNLSCPLREVLTYCIDREHKGTQIGDNSQFTTLKKNLLLIDSKVACIWSYEAVPDIRERVTLRLDSTMSRSSERVPDLYGFPLELCYAVSMSMTIVVYVNYGIQTTDFVRERVAS